MDYMEQALSLAKLALGQVSPNPAVGAIVVKDGAVVGQGYTQPAGSDHAEVMALRQAGEQARGGVMYVTLEPCSHYGRTPPCSRAIVKAGVAEVHAAMLDPNPLVCGHGMENLEQKGIVTHIGECEEVAREINEAYIKFITTGSPFVTAKFAISLDGKTASKSGDSKWISSRESREEVHNLRYIYDAIMVGANTVLTDDPLLTCRCCGGRGGTVRKQPLQIVIDGKGRTPVTARLLSEPGETLLVLGRPATPTEKTTFAQAGAELLELPLAEGVVDLKKLLKILGERGITSVLVEGGEKLLGSLFDCGLVDKVIAFMAPIIIGGEGKTAVSGTGIDKVADALRLERVRVARFGGDLMVSGYVNSQTLPEE